MSTFTKQTGTSAFEVLIAFSLISFCLIALTKNQLFVDHGYHDLTKRIQAINQVVNFSELFVTSRSNIQIQQDIQQWQRNVEKQLPDVDIDLQFETDFFSIVISWEGIGTYARSCDGYNCDDGESIMIQGWKSGRGIH